MIVLTLTVDELSALIHQQVKSAMMEVGTQAKPVTATGELTRKQVSEKYQISLPTLNKITKSGKLQGYRLGGKVLYKAAEVEAALKPMKHAGGIAR